MTIKEMEERCGISRTNIRFYEGEGLIHPERKDNGYRDYSEEDVQVLKKVRLLRSMEVPLGHVKAVASGERRLSKVLQELEQDLDLRQEKQERTRQAARQMRREETEFDTLDPDQYLDALENSTPVEDAPPRLNLPWRRYWARMFDWLLCSTLSARLLILMPWWKLGYLPLNLVIMLVVEPALLCLFGTTPGKLIFGIRVTDREGRRLSYNDGLERTWSVLWEGMALQIPLLEIYFKYRAMTDLEEGELLPWEEDTELTFADGKNWRWILFITVYGAVFAVPLLKLLGGG
ncbi:MAG: MerR family transcriptional regulator [Ruminococcaceae bacterium]|nr:MerR family transcriptional regulator [Oscillospiraceae bacterium]